MKWFPKIMFVDEMPEDVVKSILNMFKKQGRKIVSFECKGAYNRVCNIIYVKKGKHDKLVLLHELCHWLIESFSDSDGAHAWFDKHFTT